MIDTVTSLMCRPPLGSSNVAANFCDEPVEADDMTEIGDDCVVEGTIIRAFEQPTRMRPEHRAGAKRMIEVLPVLKLLRCTVLQLEAGVRSFGRYALERVERDNILTLFRLFSDTLATAAR